MIFDRKIHPELERWLTAWNEKRSQKRKQKRPETLIAFRESYDRTMLRHIPEAPRIAWVGEALSPPSAIYRVPVRIYHPAPNERLPVFIFFHGGGHVMGSVPAYDRICRKIAAAAKMIVVAPAFRLAPENPYPAPIEDGLHILNNIWAILQSVHLPYLSELSIGGDSTGGGLAATLISLTRKDPHIHFKKQILIYPWLDYLLYAPSVRQYRMGYGLERDSLRWFLEQYLQKGEDRRAVSPLYLPISPRTPPTLIINAGCDPLAGDGSAWALRLETACIPVRSHVFPDMIHPYLCLEDLVPETCEETYRLIGSFLRE